MSGCFLVPLTRHALAKNQNRLRWSSKAFSRPFGGNSADRSRSLKANFRHRHKTPRNDDTSRRNLRLSTANNMHGLSEGNQFTTAAILKRSLPCEVLLSLRFGVIPAGGRQTSRGIPWQTKNTWPAIND